CELKKFDRQFQELYLDKSNKKVSERNFIILSSTIERKQEDLINRRKDILFNIKVVDVYNERYKVYKSEIDKILSFQNLDRIMVEALIEKITISEDKQMQRKSIDIFYKFKINQ
ncbi:MAG: DUF4368 domain-containing protein, partial [Clostridium sp.]